MTTKNKSGSIIQRRPTKKLVPTDTKADKEGLLCRKCISTLHWLGRGVVAGVTSLGNRPKFGTPEKENCASSSAAKDQGGQAARKLGHAVTGDLTVSSRQMFLRTTQEEPGHCQE